MRSSVIILIDREFAWIEVYVVMMKQFRGRSLAHPGCLVGVTVGLTLGIVLAGVLAMAFNVPLSTDMLVWFGLTIGLAAIGWFVGDRLSSRFPALEEEESPDSLPPTSTPVS